MGGGSSYIFWPTLLTKLYDFLCVLHVDNYVVNARKGQNTSARQSHESAYVLTTQMFVNHNH